MGTMGSQYIRGTTDLKQERKGILIRFKGVYRHFTLIYGVFIGERVSFPQVFPHFPQWKRWMDKSGEKWWKMEGGQGNNGTNWKI